MPNEGLSQLSTIMNATFTNGAQTSTAIRSYGAELLFVYVQFTRVSNMTNARMQESTDGGTTWVDIPLGLRATVSASDNWRIVVRCGSYDRRFRFAFTSAATDASAVVVKAAFNRNPRPVLAS